MEPRPRPGRPRTAALPGHSASPRHSTRVGRIGRPPVPAAPLAPVTPPPGATAPAGWPPPRRGPRRRPPGRPLPRQPDFPPFTPFAGTGAPASRTPTSKARRRTPRPGTGPARTRSRRCRRRPARRPPVACPPLAPQGRRRRVPRPRAGLLAGAAAGTWLTDDEDGRGGGLLVRARACRLAQRPRRHAVPGHAARPGGGPGGADRTWRRVAVAPDSSCGGGFDPLLAKALSPVAARGCCGPPTPTSPAPASRPSAW
ncbi:hypothetical protein NKH77_42510 [Streptomyces sp. M19]